MAKKVKVLCGPDEISWKTFWKGLDVAANLDPRFSGSSGTIRKVEPMKRRFQALPVPISPEPSENAAAFLLRLLLRYRTRKSTDPRDKVFAILGLVVRHFGDIGIVPSYTQSAALAFTQAARYIIKETRSLWLLRACSTDEIPRVRTPSWVPDWSVTGDLAKPFLTSHSDVGRTFSAARDSSLDAAFGEEDRILRLQGKIFDSIEKIGGSLPYTELDGMDMNIKDWFSNLDANDSGENQIEQLEFMSKAAGQRMISVLQQLKVFFEWEDIANDRLSMYPTGESQRSAYRRTLCAGKIHESEKMTAKLYDAWRESLQGMRYATKAKVDEMSTRKAGFVYMALPLIKEWKSWSQDNGFASLLEHTYLRRFARTSQGYYCLVPPSTRVGDFVTIVEGGEVPLVIREYGEDWKLVGESYVHGIMHGEACRKDACKTFRFY